jgi:TFIIF-interacting CTD phosphatase-like protein
MKDKKSTQKKNTEKKIEKKIEKKTERKCVEKKYGIIVLDLDETLFHTDKNEKIHWRPYLLEFLIYLYQHFYLIVFTAALKEYADSILKKLKINKTIRSYDLFILKLYRSSVTSKGKDLRKIIKRLIADRIKKKNNIPKEFLYKMKNNEHILNTDNIILIDNLPSNFLDTQFFNGIPIKDFTTNKNDTALKILKYFFKNYLQQISKNKKLILPNISLRNFLYKNLYRINSILKIKYEKC